MDCKQHIQHHTWRNVLKTGTLLVCLFASAGIYAQESASAIDSISAQDGVSAKSKWLDDYPKHIGLTYTVGADVVSNYIWRGIQVAGLGVQPDLSVGYGGAYIDVWTSMNATDWTFQTPSAATGNAFYPEVDISLGFCRWGLDIKYLHMYYFDKYLDETLSRFFDFTDPYEGKGGITQEWRIKYRVSNKLPLHVMWCTRTWGRDGYPTNAHIDPTGKLVWDRKRAYSSYLEIGYEFALPYDLTLDANLGMTPWKSFYTLYQAEFAVVNMHLKLHRSWDLSKHCYMNAFAELMINPYDLSKICTPDDDYISINGGQQCLWNIGCGFYLK